jgi:hypothetical protein
MTLALTLPQEFPPGNNSRNNTGAPSLALSASLEGAGTRSFAFECLHSLHSRLRHYYYYYYYFLYFIKGKRPHGVSDDVRKENH